MQQELIFSTQIENQQTNVLQQLTQIPQCDPYLKKGDSNKYIDQFLQKNSPVQHKNLHQKQVVKVSDKIQQNHHEESISIGVENIQIIPHDQEQPTSIFHNFQKHLSIFLKHHMKPLKKQQMADAQIICEKFRKTFIMTTVNSKKLIHFIFGQESLTGKEKIIKQYDLKEIYSKFSASEIRKGKQLLREQTLKQIQNVDLKCYLSGTRIKNKEYFVLYVKNFMKQLKDGIFKKRIKKEGVFELR